MEQKTKTWHSSKLNRKMEIISYGWFGKPVLLFPSDDVHEYERFSMIEALKDLLDVGKIKCYLVGTLHKETWENSELPREKCGQLQNQYNDYITEEVIPYIREDCKSESLRIVSAGTGLGAFQSCTQVFRRPNLFDTLIAISGT
ncbi:MAG: esterase, partial [Planctomycetota bacterium]